MRIAVIGAGAIGGLFGGLLHYSGHAVFFVEREYKLSRLISGGLRLELPDGSAITVKAPFRSGLKGLDDLDLCLVAVKAYDTSSALRHVVEANLTCPVILLQNGLGVEDEAVEVLKRPVARGVTSCGAMNEEVGVVKVKGIAKTLLGSESDELGNACSSLAEALREAGMPAEVTDNINGAVWTKTIVNSAINPLGALLNVSNGELLESEDSKSLMAMVAAEGWRVALKLKVRLTVDDPIEETFKVAEETKSNKNSMLMDVLKCKRTEVDYINGAIWRLSQASLTDAPLNRVMYLMVKALERSKLKSMGKRPAEVS
ncbi:MAG: ketopantoate reductase family protein [Candidatus Nezhaarchaeota archaeon]|nr:ketopantoate reductase family protein [Candidatus Nezhaarchaeota archaeon]